MLEERRGQRAVVEDPRCCLFSTLRELRKPPRPEVGIAGWGAGDNVFRTKPEGLGVLEKSAKFFGPLPRTSQSHTFTSRRSPLPCKTGLRSPSSVAVRVR